MWNKSRNLKPVPNIKKFHPTKKVPKLALVSNVRTEEGLNSFTLGMKKTSAGHCQKTLKGFNKYHNVSVLHLNKQLKQPELLIKRYVYFPLLIFLI